MNKELILKMDMVRDEDLKEFIEAIQDKLQDYKIYGDEVAITLKEK